jgi:MFS family permease
VTGLVTAAVAAVVFAVSRQAVPSVVALAILGGASVAYYTSTNTLVQWVSPARLRGRILSIYTLTSIGSIPVGSLIAGALAELIGAPLTLVGGAVLAVLSLVVVIAWCPQVMHLAEGPTTAAPPAPTLQPLAGRPPQR